MKKLTPQLIREEVNRKKEQILQWTKTLIRFSSENRPPDGFEADAQVFINEECRKLGFETDIFVPDEVEGIAAHPSWLTGRNYPAGRVDVVARWKGTGKGSSLLLSGHVDVAPFEPDHWSVTRPYEPVVKKECLYGRGSADMKGGLAAAFWSLKILKELGFEPEGDILFESLVDEEFAGGNGTLAARLKGYNADLAVLMEPTRMEVCPASLGAFLGDLILSGRAGVPYMGNEIPNPIYGASRAIRLFHEWEERWRMQNSHPLFKEPGKELNVLLWCIDSKRTEEFTQMGSPLITKISWIVWCYPGMTEEEFYRQFRTFWEEHAGSDPDLKPFKLDIKPDYHFVRPWETDVNHPAVQEVQGAYREYLGKEPTVGGAPFSCDFALYGDTGRMPCVILGPRGDNLHAPDEWVMLEDIYSLTGVFALLASRWCSVGE
jgi:acetylornithine deacetylase